MRAADASTGETPGSPTKQSPDGVRTARPSPARSAQLTASSTNRYAADSCAAGRRPAGKRSTRSDMCSSASLAPRAAARHLRKVYAKLGVSSRRQPRV